MIIHSKKSVIIFAVISLIVIIGLHMLINVPLHYAIPMGIGLTALVALTISMLRDSKDDD